MTNKASSKRHVLWQPSEVLAGRETLIAKRLTRTGRFYVFLRMHRHALFDEPFQRELLAMYSAGKEGAPPVAPALLALVTLMQAYEKTSDAKAVEQAVLDLRWQLVLDCLGAEAPIFSQGVLVEFRRRLIEHDLDRRLLERTVELAQTSGAFGAKQLRVALDSAPLWGAGRVEDTFNLIEHALRVVVRCAADVGRVSEEHVRASAGLELVGKSSVKAALDIDWDDEGARHDALQRLLAEVARLRAWVDEHLAAHKEQPKLHNALVLLAKVVAQDLEPDPTPRGGKRIKQGVAADRRISISDPDMRHGRKSKSRVINGYKRHVARDLDSDLILAVTARPANEPEAVAAAILEQDWRMVAGRAAELHIDRGYLASPIVAQFHEDGGRLVAKPWPIRNGACFPKTKFEIVLARNEVRCPAGDVAPIRAGKASFGAKVCRPCGLREACTRSERGGRSIAIHPQEAMLIELRAAKASTAGRAALRQRTGVEHKLAHVSRRQGPRARYRGVRKNVLDLRRIAAVENLLVLERHAA